MKVFRSLGQFRGDSAFSTWVHRIAVTVSLNAMRKVKRLREREADLDEAHQHESEPDAIDPDLRARLAAAIEALPDGVRIALVMHASRGTRTPRSARPSASRKGRARPRYSTHGRA